MDQQDEGLEQEEPYMSDTATEMADGETKSPEIVDLRPAGVKYEHGRPGLASKCVRSYSVRP